MKKGVLVFENGRVFEGERIGAPVDSLGEAAFTTGMCGYLETLTDPSYWGQIIVQTFPLIGNYGVIPEDFEGPCAARGYIVRELCDTPSNFRCQGTLDEYLKAQGVPGLCGVDTREVTRMLRQHGAMNACIADDLPQSLDALKAYRVRGAVPATGTARAFLPAQGEARFRVTLIDYGAKASIARQLSLHGCDVTLVPWDTSAREILAGHPDGVMLSNGPGDPAENEACIREIRALCGRVPLFGICLGHQLLALALGARTEKMHFGHRGSNQPARDLVTGRTYITSQNHGYAVAADSLPASGQLRYVNANDGSCEGVDYPSLRAFSVQFHPEACAGPKDTRFLFQRFIDLMGE